MRVTKKSFSAARTLCLLAFSVLLTGCGGDGGGGDGGTTPQPDASFTLRLEQVNASLSFPLFLTAPPGDTRLFVVERGGAIKIIDRTSGNVIATFLNISNLLPNPVGSEQGLLGLAFDPQYATNRRFYVSYTDAGGNSVIARYLRDPVLPNVALSAADRIILSVAQPFANHNGGMIAFGLTDNFLYIGLGDGGDANDPGNRAQDTSVLLGKLLRIDVSQGIAPQPPYTIPPTNPFVGQLGVREEIWSIGLRNPWRFSFDRQTVDLYIADVGQGAREEVNASTFASGAGKGVNYGWKIMEGTICRPPTSMCNMAGLTLPVVDYDHSAGACSITGGYVYRGSAIPALRGSYFYGDFCARFVRSFRLVNGMATEQASWPALNPGGNITSFGEDAAGELYIMTSSGSLFRIVPN